MKSKAFLELPLGFQEQRYAWQDDGKGFAQLGIAQKAGQEIARQTSFNCGCGSLATSLRVSNQPTRRPAVFRAGLPFEAMLCYLAMWL